MPLIAHVAILDDWEAARNLGEYAVSTRGVSLDERGFVQAVALDGLGRVLAQHFADLRFDLLLVILDTDAAVVDGLTIDEPTAGRFRLHGPIPTEGASVVDVRPVERTREGYVLSEHDGS
jgi:uncharacterized protein (DUF952 family)